MNKVNGSNSSSLQHDAWHRRLKQTIDYASNKMRPSLLECLTDDHPEQCQELLHTNLISSTTLRLHVLRDLQWLFNTINNETQHDLTGFDQVRSSVLNFGIPPLAGKNISNIEWHNIQQQLTTAILHFEPRILPPSLEIRCMENSKKLDLHNMLSIEIKGYIRCAPYPVEFLFRTDIDLEDGHFELREVR